MRRIAQRAFVFLFCALAGAAACSSPSASQAPPGSAGTATTPTAGAGGAAAPTAGTTSSAAGTTTGGGSSSAGNASTTAGTGGAPAATCPTACGAGEVCTNGQCACATGHMKCGGTCVDVQSDAANCGACAKACAANQVCSKGTCGAGCAAGLTKCGTACVDITGSAANCGMCGNACPATQSCWQSACICPTGQGACGANGACVDTASSLTNCGACNNQCATGATCTKGVCTCPAGGLPCSGACVDAASDEANCGACGKTCSGGLQCLSGACLDPSTLSCSGAKANEACTKDANITLGPYWVNNNWWGATAANGQACIWSNCSTGDLTGWGQSFNWTGDASQVKSYASIIFGWQWGWKTNAGGQRLVTALPLQLNTSKAVNCGWSFTVTPTGNPTFNVSYDLFAHTLANPGTNDDPTDEIMIWLYRGNGAAPIGTKQSGSLSAGGGTFDLYDGANDKWKVHSYVRQTNATTAVLNMMDFAKDLASRGLLANTKYLTSIQAGAEVFVGQGTVQTNGFYCRVQ